MSHYIGKISEHAVIFSEKMHVLLLKTPPWKQDGQSRWLFPGGRLEEDDQPCTGLMREIEEETGLIPPQVEILLPFHTSRWGYETPLKYSVLYLARVKGEPEIFLNHEHVAYRWVNPDDLQEYLLVSDTYAEAIHGARVLLQNF